MFKMTRNDLARKTSAQLASLFNQVNQGLGGLADPGRDRDQALSLLAMIRTEQSTREPQP